MIKIKKPGSLIIKERNRKSLDDVWPDIISLVASNPNTTNDKLFDLFSTRSGDTDKLAFNRKCNLRGLSELRRTLSSTKKKKKANNSIQLTEEAIQDFEKNRRKKGVMFLGRMDSLVSKGIDSVEKESKRVAKSKKGEGLSDHLTNLSKISKLGKEVYNLDAESGQDKTKMNLALVMNFMPSAEPTPAKGTVIDV